MSEDTIMEDKKRTLIPLPYFFEEAVLLIEKEQLFAKSWLFVCFKRDLANDGDFFSLDFLGVSIVIRNFEGELKAFQNVCLHRFSKICLHEKGNGLLQCAYHGWTYNQEGKPYAIPAKKSFSLPAESDLRLKQFEIEVIGEFVFIRLANGPSINESIDESTMTSLLKISNALNEKIDINSFVIEVNWKIIVENTLEEYHIRQVHPDSFSPVEIKQSTYDFSNYHSSALMEFGSKLARSKKLDALYSSRPWQVNDYFHQVVSPNLTIASVYGATIGIQQIKPLSSTKTLFISHVFSTKIDNADHALAKAFNQNAIDFNRRVFEEDKEICEAVQIGIEQINHGKGFLSTQEERVWHFEKTYMDAMKEPVHA